MSSVPPVEVFGYIGIIPTLLMFGLPLMAIRDAWRSPLPLQPPQVIDGMIGMFANCVVWLTYGSIVFNPIVIVCNLAGLIVSLIGITVYYTKTAGDQRRRQQLAIGLVGALVGVIVFIETVLVSYTYQVVVSGLIACAGSFVLFLTPLTVTYHAWRDKDVRALSLPSILGMLSSAGWWTIYGLAKPDYYIGIINLCGLLLTALSVITFFKYRHFKKRSEAEEDSSPTGIAPPTALTSVATPGGASPPLGTTGSFSRHAQVPPPRSPGLTTAPVANGVPPVLATAASDDEPSAL